MGSKVLRGSFISMVGNIIFRFGGYIYRFLMASLLGPANYGILGLTLPFQGIFQILSAGGLPPAIAKYMSEYQVLDEKDLAREIIYTSLKIAVILGLFFGFFMVFFAAPYIANYFQKPEVLLPLQIVGLITPFSAIIGAFRGAFQGVFKMEYVLYTRAVEQIGMILFATAFVLIGLSVAGAVFGTALAFLFSTLLSIYIFKYKMGEFIPKRSSDFIFTLKDELKLTKQLVVFSIPVIITALAEMFIYTITVLIMGRFLTSTLVGYYVAADVIARIPLIIAISLAPIILPASAEAFSSKNQKQLNLYVTSAYKYSMLFVVPMCIGIALFAKEILEVVYFTNYAYTFGADALAILTIGMAFYSIFVLSTSIIQGIGNPRVPMYILIIGVLLTLFFSLWLVPIYGIVGGAISSTMACFIMIFPILYFVFKLTKTKVSYKPFLKIFLASIVMGLFILILPNNILGFILGIVACPLIYFALIILSKFFTLEDIDNFRGYTYKLGPLSNLGNKILNVVEKFSVIN